MLRTGDLIFAHKDHEQGKQNKATRLENLQTMFNLNRS